MAIACSGEPTPTTTSAPTTSTTAAITTTSSTTATSTTVPADIQESIDWFVGVLNGDTITAEEYDSRFTPEFQEEVPFDPGFLLVLDQLRPGAPYVVLERSGEGIQGEAVVEGADGTLFRVLAEARADGRMSALLVQPAELENPPETVAEAFEQLSEMGTARAIAAEITDGECTTIETVAPDQPAPLGSVFKLYVLAALGDAIDEGILSWDDEVTISDDLKSIPSGTLQDRPAGETVSVLETAELMISISDNTATDHLIDLLGRETVEAALTAYGNSVSELSTPFLDTLEFAALKVGPASGLSTQWVDADEDGRKQILTQISAITAADIPVQEWTEPVMPDLIEWFATPSDLCALAVGLDDLAERVPEIGEILEINPGVPAEEGTWDRIWFKGGAEPGLLAMWFRTGVDGQVFVTAGSVVNPDSNIDQTRASLLFAAARDLLAP